MSFCLFQEDEYIEDDSANENQHHGKYATLKANLMKCTQFNYLHKFNINHLVAPTN